jgi:hypothetical protein
LRRAYDYWQNQPDCYSLRKHHARRVREAAVTPVKVSPATVPSSRRRHDRCRDEASSKRHPRTPLQSCFALLCDLEIKGGNSHPVLPGCEEPSGDSRAKFFQRLPSEEQNASAAAHFCDHQFTALPNSDSAKLLVDRSSRRRVANTLDAMSNTQHAQPHRLIIERLSEHRPRCMLQATELLSLLREGAQPRGSHATCACLSSPRTTSSTKRHSSHGVPMQEPSIFSHSAACNLSFLSETPSTDRLSSHALHLRRTKPFEGRYRDFATLCMMIH